MPVTKEGYFKPEFCQSSIMVSPGKTRSKPHPYRYPIILLRQG